MPRRSRSRVAYRIEVLDGARVGVSAFDVLGRRVARLLDRRLEPGRHEFSWEPKASLPSGTYFLRLESGDVRESRKVVLSR